MYGRINERGELEIYKKRFVKIGNALISNPSQATMARVGYKPIVMTEAPQLAAGQTLSVEYRDTGAAIEGIFTVIGGLK